MCIRVQVQELLSSESSDRLLQFIAKPSHSFLKQRTNHHASS